MPVYALGDRQPQLAEPVWIAPDAVVVGDVRLAANVSIWWHSTLRGDNEPITIGENSNIQDGCVLHTDEGIPLTIAANVTIGHKVILHGCTIGEGSLVGMGAIVLNRAVVGRECLIGAHTLIPEGRVIPDRSLVVGTPGRVVRQLSDEEVANIAKGCAHYVENWQHYQAKLKRLDG